MNSLDTPPTIKQHTPVVQDLAQRMIHTSACTSLDAEYDSVCSCQAEPVHAASALPLHLRQPVPLGQQHAQGPLPGNCKSPSH